MARSAGQSGFQVMIVTSDKDMMQLVTDRVSLMNPMKDDAVYDPAEVKEFLGVPPEKVADLLALKGDAVDNIPGAPGIGDKGANGLIREFGSVEAAAGPRRRGEAKDVSREPREQPRAGPDEQASGDHRHRRPIEWKTDDFRRPRAGRRGLAGDLPKHLEFYSLLRELDEKTAPAAEGRRRLPALAIRRSRR